MEQNAKIATTKLLASETTMSDSDVSVYLTLAEESILSRLYPIKRPTLEQGESLTVPPEYEMLQCRLASRYIVRRGGEGEEVHNENGINRSYGSVNDEDLLMEVVQRVL